MTLWSGQLYDVWRYGRNQRMTQCITQCMTLCVGEGTWVGEGTCNVLAYIMYLGFGQKIHFSSICLDFWVRCAARRFLFINTNSTTWYLSLDLTGCWLLSGKLWNYGVYDAMFASYTLRHTSYRVYDAMIWPAVSRITLWPGQLYHVSRYDLARRITLYAYHVSRLTPC